MAEVAVWGLPQLSSSSLGCNWQYLLAELWLLASVREHEAASTLRSFYFRKGDRIFSQVAFNQNEAQSKTIGGGRWMGQAISLVRLIFARLLGEKIAYVFPLVRVEFGHFSFLSKLSGELSELDFSLLRGDVTDLLH